jgi:hypothetical protein
MGWAGRVQTCHGLCFEWSALFIGWAGQAKDVFPWAVLVKCWVGNGLFFSRTGWAWAGLSTGWTNRCMGWPGSVL